MPISYKTACSAHGVQDRGAHVFYCNCGTMAPCPVGEDMTGKTCASCKRNVFGRMCALCVTYFEQRGGRVPVERARS